jgi:hypothetical protein
MKARADEECVTHDPRDVAETPLAHTAGHLSRRRRRGKVTRMSKKTEAGEKAVIADVVRNSILWALTKDVQMQKDTMAHDEDLLLIWTGSMHITSGWK